MASDLPVDLLEEIFLHLDDTADLARASAPCACFHRVISNHRFLRRFRCPHRRPLLGFLESRGDGRIEFYPAQSSRRSALAAVACAEAADFTFSFIPGPNRWRVRDARDGRVLLSPSQIKPVSYGYEDLVVCDPLHRRHVLIPPIPDHLLDAAASAEDGGIQALRFDPFFAPEPEANEDGRDDGDRELPIRVMCNALSKTKVVAFAFSSAGQWQAIASFSNPNYQWKDLPWLWCRQSSHSCFFWTSDSERVMLVLDTRGMKFSIITDIPHYGLLSKIVVEAGEGRLGLLHLGLGSKKLELYSKAWHVNVLEPAEEWRHDNTIPMPIAGTWSPCVVAEGYALIRCEQFEICDRNPNKKKPEAHYFTVDLKTMLIEKLCVGKFGSYYRKFLYVSFPPPFHLLPTV